MADISTVLHRAAELTANGKGRKAVALLRPVAVAHPRQQEVWCRLAAAHLDRGDPGAALDAVRRALRLTGDRAWAHRLASRALSRMGRHEEAVSAARHALREAPSDGRCQLALAEALGSADRWDEALSAARRAVELDPAQIRCYLVLGDAATRLRQWTTAERAYRAALRHKPGDARIRAQLTRLRQARSGGARPEPSVTPTRPRRDPVGRAGAERLFWHAGRQVSSTAVISALMLLISGLPRPTQPLAWFGLALPVVVLLAALVVLVRTPSGGRWAMLTAPCRNPAMLVTCALVGASLGLTLLWAFQVRLGSTSVEVLLLATACAVGAAALCFAKGS
ncbi:hypothetical protein GCM10010174_36690 [Kutzneria viridogrisea]|uniref:Flp pilus assembly protein TadD n=1 Tax=Kutzneria viridogrisea TaxID=47990 RepID=A0ABR6BU41_9PSEU|nr:Flp pilus assembly protein TadD [Kutzneria viridogrisea]